MDALGWELLFLVDTMRNVIEKAADFATERVQFGATIESYGSIQEKISCMAMLHYANESMAYMVAGIMDSGANYYRLEAAISKIFAS